jgi:hypothetical protein
VKRASAWIAVVIALALPGAAGAQNTWTGTWEDVINGGAFQLTQSGTAVSGTYTFCSGSVSGTVDGNAFTGTWSQQHPCGGAPEGSGPFRFTLAADGRSFGAAWQYGSTCASIDTCLNPRSDWGGRCTAGGCLQNAAPATAPPPPPVSPASTRPALGAAISYAMPPPGAVLAAKLPGLPAGQRTVTASVDLVRQSGLKVDDDSFVVAVTDANARKATRLCTVLLIDDLITDKAGTGEVPNPAFGQCVAVVARILQRAEDLRRQRGQPPARAAQVGACRARTLRRRGRLARNRRVSVGCTATATGLQVTVRRGRRASLSTARLIVARVGLVPAQPDDRVNVTWR